MYGYILKIASHDGAYEYEVSFFDKDKRWEANGTCPSIEACFDAAQTFLRDHGDVPPLVDFLVNPEKYPSVGLCKCNPFFIGHGTCDVCGGRYHPPLPVCNCAASRALHEKTCPVAKSKKELT